MLRLVLSILLINVLALTWAHQLCGQTSREFEKAHQELLNIQSYQFSLPFNHKEETPQSNQHEPPPEKPRSPNSNDPPKPDSHFEPPSLFDTFLLMLKWLIVNLVGLMAFVYVGTFFLKPAQTTQNFEAISELANQRISDEAMKKITERVYALAEQKHYALAIHELLLYTIRDIRFNLDTAISESMTSREIVRRASVPPTAARELSVLVSKVEISFFGGNKTSYDDFKRCLESFQNFFKICYMESTS